MPEDIAGHLSRNPEAVKKYMHEQGLMKYYSSSQIKNNDKITDITTSVYWRDFQKQFSPQELDSVKYHWANTIKQFRDDIMHTEEIQIVDMVKIQILMDRILNQEADIIARIKSFETIVQDEKDKPPALQDKDTIRNYESQIASLYAAVESVSKEFRELLKEKTNLFKTLKATREQRIKQVESSKETMSGWYRNLFNNHQLRTEIGIYIAKMQIATKVEYEKMSEFHTYADGSVDRVILTPEE